MWLATQDVVKFCLFFGPLDLVFLWCFYVNIVSWMSPILKNRGVHWRCMPRFLLCAGFLQIDAL